MTIILGIALAVIALNFRSCIQNRQDYKAAGPYAFKKEGTLSFFREGLDKPLVTIDIELAKDDNERAMGLMHRYTMDEEQGMLFIMERQEPQSFWMKNTHISLDILYVNTQYEIVKIHQRTKRFSEEGIPSVKPAKYVVEVVAGFCAKHQIKEGDLISFKRITSDN
ncbi:DUF192 domain-containing protein [Carboxylicivirga sediminis]|uniref:DUF192 domain-containing protein n=1 Tax=Carboxylicivirga sediminis TaxID=2006564 RepID=A0A941F6E8_9BACT|nr:DUF192 domain-containing protein [Carboxylicivirga sediminis]MBR8537242.1 DUF192 domain-containing protein [Carboxylicivirga sediminis]